MTAAVRVKGAQGTPAWLDNRRDVVGSSDVPVITGTSPYSTSRVDLWAVKTRLLEPDPPDEAMQELYDLGTALEPIIADRYELATGRRVRRVRDQLRHPEHAWVGASLDRVTVGERRIVECKWAPNRHWSEGGDVPAHVQQQVQWQMLVTGYAVADVAVLNGSRVEVHTIEADRAYQDDLLYVAWHDLWTYVERREMPELDGTEQTRRALARLQRASNGVVLDARRGWPDLVDMAHRLREAQLAEKAAGGEVGTIKNAIGAILLGQESTVAQGDGWRIDWNQQRPGTRTDWRSVAGAYRALLEQAHDTHDMDDAAWDDWGALTTPEALEALIGLHSETRDGARPMRLWVKDEETGRWV